jgi:hypothetical protein
MIVAATDILEVDIAGYGRLRPVSRWSASNWLRRSTISGWRA